MKKHHRFLALCLVALLGVPAFAAGTAEQSATETRTVVDHTGTTVVIPKDINRIVISSVYPLPSVYCLFEGNADKLVGMHPSSMAAARNSILTDIMPDIVDVNSDFVTGSQINIEEVINLRPDVVFYNASYADEGEALRQAGIPAVAFSTSKWQFDPVATFNGWVELLGQVLQKESQAKGIVEYGEQVYGQIFDRVSSIPEEDKPRVLILFRYANGQIRTSGSNFFGQYWIESTGGINVASELSGMPQINMEQIYEWNPDMIYITNFCPVLPEDLYGNAIEGDDWSQVKAVKDRQVYKFPLGMYRWFPPASDTPLVFEWLAMHNHPELFGDLDMEGETVSYYKRAYGVDLTDDQLYRIFHPSRDAADE